MKHLLPIILSILLLYACGESGRNSQLLERAEAVMNDSCEIALSILQDSIDSTTLATERGRAIYAVLLSQALDKNYIDIASDSIIAPAIIYFADGNDPHYAMLTHYYHAVVLFNANDLSASAIACMEAEQYAITLNNNYQLARIYALLSFIHNYTYNFNEELYYCNKSLDQFYFSKDFKQINNAKIRLAESYNNINDFEKSASIYNEILTNTDKIDTLNIVSALKGYSHTLIIQGKYQEAKKYIYSISDKYNTPLTSIEYSNLGKIYIHLNMLDSAEYYLSKGESTAYSTQETIALNSGKYLLYLSKKDYKKALNLKNQQNYQQNNTTKIIWDQSVMTLQRDYFESQAKNATLEIKAQKNQIILIVIISVAILFIATFIIYALRMKNKAQKERTNRILSEHYQSQNLISNAEKRISELEALLENETDKSQRLINELEIQKESLQLYTQQAKLREEATNAIETSDVATRFRKALDENANPTKEDWEQLDNYINLQFPGFKSVLYKLVKLSEIEYQVSLLIKCKFSPNEIGRLVNLSKSGLGNARKRLFVKAFKTDGTATDWDNFIISL